MKQPSKRKRKQLRESGEKLFFKNSKNQRLAGVIHFPSKPTSKPADKGIVICHGYASSKDGKAKKLAQFFAKNGYAALRFDFTGCGESQGALDGAVAKQEISDARKAIGVLQSRGISRIGIIGSSLGGLVVVSVSALDKRIRATVALCPPANLFGYHGLEKAGKAKKILFIHGTADAIVHPHESKEYFEAARPPKKLVFVRDADHNFSKPRHLRTVEREALAWFNKYV